jgi:TPR repeat protein
MFSNFQRTLIALSIALAACSMARRAEADDAPPPAGDCERLAAPAPPFATPEQIKASKTVDWPRAVLACEAALNANPGEARLHYLLGRAYDSSKRYLEARRHYAIAVDAENPAAENALGVMLVVGHGAVKDYQRAFDLFSKSALAGDGAGMGDLGSMYSNGFFVKEDDAKALDWYEKAIEAGNSFGLAQAGVMYFDGKGTPRDYNAAEQYFQQAADLGDGYSLKFLAIMYERGLVGKPDPAKASELRLRAAQIDPDSQNPNVPPSPKAVARTVHASAGSRTIRIRRYRFLGCSWVWC